MSTKINGYSRKQSSSQKCSDNKTSGKKSGGHSHKSSGKKSGSKHKSSGKKNCCCEHKSSSKCYEHKSSSKCHDHKSNGCKCEHGCSDNSAIPYNQGDKSSGNRKSNAEYAYSILSKLSLGQVIHRVTLDNGKDLDKVKWAGFRNGNATFSAFSYKTTYIVYVPLNKITSIAL